MKESWSYLGSTYEQIKALIDELSYLSVDGLFGAACNVVHSIFGDLQNSLLQDLQSGSPPTAFQQCVNALRVSSIVPLQSLTGYGSTVRPTAATRPGVVTTRPCKSPTCPARVISTWPISARATGGAAPLADAAGAGGCRRPAARSMRNAR